MRRAALIAALATLSSLAGAAQALAQSALAVPVDQSRRVPFAGQANSVVSGNAEIAYAYVISPTDVRVVGRKTGLTNLVVLDAAGRTLFEREIAVGSVGSGGSTVTIYRGGQATSYTCSPYCNQQNNSRGDGGVNPIMAPSTLYPAPTSVAAPDPLASVADLGQKLTGAAQAVQSLREATESVRANLR